MKLLIGGATLNQIPFDWTNNSRNIVDAITEAKSQGIKILCLPELCITGYGCEDVFLSEWLPERAWQELLHIRKFCDGITVSLGLPLRIGQTIYNGACVISNQKLLGITLKQFLARDGVHYEPRWFDPWIPGRTLEIVRGEEKVTVGDIVYDVEGIRFGFEICEDGWRNDDRPGHSLSKRGVQLILNPSASHFAMVKSVLREKQVVIDGSGMFRCAYVFANLLGNESGRMIYDGDIIIGQNGKLVAVNNRFSFKQFHVLATEIDFEDPSKTQEIASTDNKEQNEDLAEAITLGLFDYIRKSKAKGFVLSLSGGADSSMCAVVVAEMIKRAWKELGAQQFCSDMKIPLCDSWKSALNLLLSCAYQGTENSSEVTFNAAKLLADSINAEFHYWKIDEEVASYTAKIEEAIQRKLSWSTDDITLQNIQARTRSPIIWMLANVKQAVLITTSNRSEGDLGYATMDGDTSGSFAPIAGLSKPFIIQWLRWAEKALDHPGLALVNNLQPTAELRPLENQQTDEQDLMPYSVLVEIERHAIYYRKSPVQVYHDMKHNYDAADLKVYIRKFFRLWCANQWKRERFAPSLHLDDLNVDPRTWCRFPILSSGFVEELALLDHAV